MRAGSWREADELDAAEQVALELAELGTATPPAVDEALFARLREHFSPPQIVELDAIVAWENYRARFNVILGIEGHGFFLKK